MIDDTFADYDRPMIEVNIHIVADCRYRLLGALVAMLCDIRNCQSDNISYGGGEWSGELDLKEVKS